jgi:diguanylate cyclase (GGDEF)-like protein
VVNESQNSTASDRVTPEFADLRSFPDFDSAAERVLEYLQSQLGFRLWMLTRTEGEDWIVLHTRERAGSIPIVAGDVLRWSDTICSRMVLGRDPRVAPRALDVPAYAEAPATTEFGVAAYVGVPLTADDGTLFGTLCAVDSVAQPPEVVDAQPLIELCAQLLSTLLDREKQLAAEERRREQAEQELNADVLTGVLSRRAWERLQAKEEARSRRSGAPACVIVGDLDNLKDVNDRDGHAAGDELLQFAGGLLAAALRASDVVGRLGGDEFAVLAPETNLAEGRKLVERIRGVLDAADISMSLGIAQRDPRRDLAATLVVADQAMLAEKAARKAQP